MFTIILLLSPTFSKQTFKILMSLSILEGTYEKIYRSLIYI